MSSDPAGNKRQREIQSLEESQRAKSSKMVDMDAMEKLAKLNLPNSTDVAMLPVKIKFRFSFRHFSLVDVKQAIEGLSNSKARDVLNFSNHILKIHAADLAPIMMKIFNECASKGIFPEILKYSVVKPLFKSGNKTQLGNYRPITIVSPFSKVFEKLILSQFLPFLEENSLISELQFGFTRKSNTETAVLNLLHDIFSSVDDKKYTAALFIDLRKTFDMLNHSILLKKISQLNLPRNFHNLIASFIENRSQSVKIDHSLSCPLNCSSGVAQGSIMGPPLLFFYINDIFKLKLNGKVQLYADDIAIVYSKNSYEMLESSMCEDLETLNKFLESHMMAINTEKSSYILFQRRKKLEQYTLKALKIQFQNQYIQGSSSYEYLGLVLDESLSFADHLKKIKSKIIPFSYAVKRTFHLIPRKTIKLLVVTKEKPLIKHL
jgi:hypothetical protein